MKIIEKRLMFGFSLLAKPKCPICMVQESGLVSAPVWTTRKICKGKFVNVNRDNFKELISFVEMRFITFNHYLLLHLRSMMTPMGRNALRFYMKKNFLKINCKFLFIPKILVEKSKKWCFP
jgi:hypothetical protein